MAIFKDSDPTGVKLSFFEFLAREIHLCEHVVVLEYVYHLSEQIVGEFDPREGCKFSLKLARFRGRQNYGSSLVGCRVYVYFDLRELDQPWLIFHMIHDKQRPCVV